VSFEELETKFDLQLFAEESGENTKERGDTQGDDSKPEGSKEVDNLMPGSKQGKGEKGQTQAAQQQFATDSGMETVANLYNLLSSDPGLANAVADAIERYLQGGAGMQTVQSEQTQQVAGSGGSEETTTEAASQEASVPPEIMERLSRLERGQAEVALEKEMNNAKQLYNQLTEEFPILPELNEQELLRIATQYPGLPLDKAVNVWAVDKMRDGEGGTPAERIMAAMMEKQQSEQPPAPEGRGGSAPSGEAPPPRNFRQARRGIRELLDAIDRGVTGA